MSWDAFLLPAFLLPAELREGGGPSDADGFAPCPLLPGAAALADFAFAVAVVAERAAGRAAAAAAEARAPLVGRAAGKASAESARQELAAASAALLRGADIVADLLGLEKRSHRPFSDPPSSPPPLSGGAGPRRVHLGRAAVHMEVLAGSCHVAAVRRRLLAEAAAPPESPSGKGKSGPAGRVGGPSDGASSPAARVLSGPYPARGEAGGRVKLPGLSEAVSQLVGGIEAAWGAEPAPVFQAVYGKVRVLLILGPK